MSLRDDEFDGPGYPGPTRGRVVRFNAIFEAWEFFKERWASWMLATLIALVVYSAVSALVGYLAGVAPLPGVGPFRAPLRPRAQISQAVLTTVVAGFFLGGMFRMACRQVRGYYMSGELLLSVTDVLPQLLIGSALYALICTVGYALLIVPGLIASGLLMFLFPLIVDGRLPATEALKQSYHALKGEWLAASVFHLLAWAVSGFGGCCCIGLLVTVPLYSLSIAILYRDCFLTAAKSGVKPPPMSPPGF